MTHPEGFSDTGIALTDEAKVASRQAVASAVVGFCRGIAALRRKFPGLKIAEIGGSHAHPEKQPRYGVLPSHWHYEDAIECQLNKRISPLPPSDVDVVLVYPPGDKKNHTEIYGSLIDLTKQIFYQNRVLIHPLKKNPDPYPAISVRKLLDWLNGK